MTADITFRERDKATRKLQILVLSVGWLVTAGKILHPNVPSLLTATVSGLMLRLGEGWETAV